MMPRDARWFSLQNMKSRSNSLNKSTQLCPLIPKPKPNPTHLHLLDLDPTPPRGSHVLH